MGALIAIVIVWWFIAQSETKEARKKQRKVGAAVALGSPGWFFESIWNAGKYNKY